MLEGCGRIGDLTVCGIDEIDAVMHQADTTLSLVDPGYGGKVRQRPDAPVRHRVIEVDDVIVPGLLDAETARQVVRDERLLLPTADDTRDILKYGKDLGWFRSDRVLVHCHAGISRSTAAALLLLVQHHGSSAIDDAVQHIQRIRPCAMPNIYIVDFGDALLGLEGRLHERVDDTFGALSQGLAEDMLPLPEPETWWVSERGV